MDEKKEIKPCPFCGGKVQHHRNSFECAKCGYTIVFDNLKYYRADTFPKRHDLALEVWNTRTVSE